MVTTNYFSKLNTLDNWSKAQLSSLENIPSPIYCGDCSEKMIALMINVAWGNEYLLDLLDILKANNVKATFFLDGSWVNKYPLLAKKILDAGHDIGSHAYSHPDMRGLTLERIKWQLQKTNEIIEEILGIKPKLFTPPAGEFDERVVYLAAQEGMLTVLSTIDTLDWQNPAPEDLIHDVELALKNGAMILIHPTKSSLLALPGIIKKVKDHNYTLDSISHLLAKELQLGQLRLMNVEKGILYVDGQPIDVEYLMNNDELMVPASFFKHAGIEVTLDFHNSQILLSTSDKNHAFDMINGTTYLSLHEVAPLFNINLLCDPETLRIYLITQDSSLPTPQIVFKGSPFKNKVALTFDDGPDDYHIPKILDILKSKGVKATFFVVGEQVSIFPEILKRIVSEGHSIGNHTWSHPHLATLSTSELMKELKTTQEIIFSLTGLTPTLFRPPFASLALSDYYTIDKLGFKIINWNIDTLDYEGLSAQQIMAIVETEMSPGSIILQHSFQNFTGILDGSLAALPIIIDRLQANNMEFVTVDELI